VVVDSLLFACRTPLPLLTAPVLIAFLHGAGHMLANKHPDEFKIHLDTIMNDDQALDDGPIGKPSATRLRKFVEDGFVPSRAPYHHEHCRSCTSALHRTVVDSRRGLVSIWRVVVRPSHAGSFRRRQQSNTVITRVRKCST
jgi:hypothetical protein